MLQRFCVALLAASWLTATGPARADRPKTQAKIRVLIIDGQNNHDWRATTPVMKKALEVSGRYQVDVATAPQRPPVPPKPKAEAQGQSAHRAAIDHYSKELLPAYRRAMEKFHPDLGRYQVVVSNYNGDPWGQAFQKAFARAIGSGKVGLVIVHAANNSFGGWADYNRMIGLGWRDPSFGKRLFLDEEGKKVVLAKGKGEGSGHRYVGEFDVVIRDAEHPVTRGMPRQWRHARDELYDNLRGPAEHMHILATAFSQGTGAHEPMIWTVTYDKGRVFHTPMGHDVTAMRCIGFITTLQRGTEWAATGSVTIGIPENFPTARKSSSLQVK